MVHVRRDQFAKAARFYEHALQLPVIYITPDDGPAPPGAEFDAGSANLALTASDRESELSVGYSPLLHFDVDDLDAMVPRVIQYGAHMDGGVEYEVFGKTVNIRSPCGQMFALFEPADASTDGGE